MNQRPRSHLPQTLSSDEKISIAWNADVADPHATLFLMPEEHLPGAGGSEAGGT
jgi:hypothetical protein